MRAMKWTAKSYAGAVLLGVALLGVPACKKRPAQAMASDLQQAGYKLTTEDWFRAAATNDVEAMKKFISAGFSDKTKDVEGNGALHHAAKGGAEKSAEYLLNRKLPIEDRNNKQRTPLMLAVMEKQSSMTRYLLRQGADPLAKDADGYTPLMLAVREGSANCVSELATYSRGDLDAALLLSAMEGSPPVIDALTNYGASVYARMEDGRTPLMIAAENGQLEAVKLLAELGSSRFTTDAEGHTAADLATAAGFPEIATYLSQEPTVADLSLESDEQVAAKMDAYVDAAASEGIAEPSRGHSLQKGETVADEAPSAIRQARREPARSLQGETLSDAVVRDFSPPREKRGAASAPATAAADPDLAASATSDAAVTGKTFSAPPIVMRHYREREVPVEIRTVEGDTAVIRITGARPRETRVKPGQTIPGSDLVVVKVHRRMESSKLNLGQPTEVSVVEVRDGSSGATQEWIAGVGSRAHDPVALVEDSATGRRYVAAPGQRFKAADGHEFIVSDVRPNQMVIEDSANGEVQTIPLSGPRG